MEVDPVQQKFILDDSDKKRLGLADSRLPFSDAVIITDRANDILRRAQDYVDDAATWDDDQHNFGARMAVAAAQHRYAREIIETAKPFIKLTDDVWSGLDKLLEGEASS